MQASSAFCLSAWANLTLLGFESLNIVDAHKLLPFFEERRKEDPVTQGTLGWVSEVADPDGEPSLWSTALAVETLKRIEIVIGRVINQKVFAHFTVRRPSVPGLDDLFYPDYGLAAAKATNEAAALPRESVGLELQRMRAHIAGFSNIERTNSVVLHGPAGTGKTTLAESLAVTCGVELVEVTPSDISQAGTDGVEGRSRAVFEALGLLSKVVILFDEFDPLLQRRSDDGRGERNIFMFLTPGMLPKLKLLHEQAALRQVAAVRQGRFDKKIGIYPPDVVSRLGRMQLLCHRAITEARARGDSTLSINEDRLGTFIVHTGGRGMTALAKHGWYSFNPRRFDAITTTPLGHILDLTQEFSASIPEPEDSWPKQPRGNGQAAEREHAQWRVVEEWDQSARDVETRARHDFYKNLEADIQASISKAAGPQKPRK
jgi:predicted ATPase